MLVATHTGCVKLKRAHTYCVGFSVYMRKLLGNFVIVLRLNIGCIPGRQTAQAGLEFTELFLGQTIEDKMSIKLCTACGGFEGTSVSFPGTDKIILFDNAFFQKRVNH